MWIKIKNNWKIISIIIIGLIIFLWGKSCGNKTIEPTEPKVVTITNYRDTIFPKDTIYTPKDRPVPYPVYIDSSKYRPKPIDSLEIHGFFTHKDTSKDSSIEIYSDIHTQGKTLVANKISYKLKVPLIIKDCTVVKRDTFIYQPSKYEVHVGILAGFNTIAPTVELSIDKNTFGAAYDPFNKYPYIIYKRRIFKSKK